MSPITRRRFGSALAAVGLASACASSGVPDQDVLAVAIDEGMFVDINGLEQWITVRGRDMRNPVLLLLHGGPGASLSRLAPVFADWENDFTLVQWDQPGAGSTSLKTPGGQGPLTFERFAKDGIAVTEFARKRLRAEKVVLMGVSAGTQIGIRMLRQRPDLFSAYVGTAQLVGSRGTLLGYELALKAARERNDKTGVETLERFGPPPYKTWAEIFAGRQRYTDASAVPPSPIAKAATEAMNRLMSVPPTPDARYIARGFETPPSGFDTKTVMATLQATYEGLFYWEVRDFGKNYPIPMFVFQGENDINAPTILAKEFVAEITAPKKMFVIISGAGHNTIPFHDDLLALMRTHVLPIVRATTPH